MTPTDFDCALCDTKNLVEGEDGGHFDEYRLWLCYSCKGDCDRAAKESKA